jgi:hypothetical protein
MRNGYPKIEQQEFEMSRTAVARNCEARPAKRRKAIEIASGVIDLGQRHSIAV